MGMFDRIFITCPKCKGRVECQSKSGPQRLQEYELEDAPMQVVAGIIDGDGYTYCNTCKKDVLIEVKSFNPQYKLSIKVNEE